MAFPLLNLHEELKRRTASFLSPTDATRLSRTCKAMHYSLSLTTLSPDRVLCPRKEFVGDAEFGDYEFPFIRIPVFSRRVHSITLSFNWRDQGWGNRKSQFWIVGYPAQGRIDYTRRFFGGRLVYESAIAQHESVPVRGVTFCPMEGEMYQIWFRVGGGGGHRLLFDEISTTTLIFDSEERRIARNYQKLVEVGVLCSAVDPPRFYLELLMQALVSIRHRRSRGEAPDDRMLVFFEDYGFPTDEASLRALEEILQGEIREQTEAVPSLEQMQSDDEADGTRMVLSGRPPFVPRRVQEGFYAYLDRLHESMTWGTLEFPRD